MDFDFTGKTALATGAASGMGLLFCQRFVESGGNALLVDVNEAGLKEKTDAINREYPGRADYAVCDVRDYGQVCAARDKAVARFGSIDVLVNFAGGAELRMLKVGYAHEFPDVPIEVYDWSLDVNLRGQFYFDHAVMKQMREQKSGVVVNIGSITGEEGTAKDVGYSTAKSAAMNGLTRSIAQFGAKYGIRCVCVAPGPVLTRADMANMKTAEGRAAEPREIVDLVLYVASDAGSFFDGVTLLMDGGRSILYQK